MKMMLPHFLKLDALQRYFGVINQFTQSHFADSWENQNQAHAFELAQNHTFKLAARLFVSLEDEEDVEKLRKPLSLVNAGTVALPIDLPGTPLNKAIKAAKLIRKDLNKMIKQRKVDLAEGNASPRQEGMLSQMLLTCDEHGSYLKKTEIADKIIGMLVAAFDTVSSSLTFIVKYLAELPHVYDAVYKEQMEIVNSKTSGEPLKWEDLQRMKYSWNVAQVLRMTPPVQGNFREALTDFVYNGSTIPKGWKLYRSANRAHKNADYFPEPEKFDPSRFEGNGLAPYMFVPFGGGPRNQYAKVVILVFMHHLVTRFKWDKVILDEKTIVVALPTPAKGLPIRLFHHRRM